MSKIKFKVKILNLCNLVGVNCKSADPLFRWLGEMDRSSEEDWGLNITSIEPPGQNCYRSLKKVSEGPFYTLCYFR
jgi:hypothetical protein